MNLRENEEQWPAVTLHKRGRRLCRGAEPAARPGTGAGGGPSSCRAGRKRRCPHRTWRPRRRKPSRRSRDAPRRRPFERRRPPRAEQEAASPRPWMAAAGRSRSEPGAACPPGRVPFPGAVCRESGCRFARHLLKRVLERRQQLPLPYERLGCFCRRVSGREGAPGAVLPRPRVSERGSRSSSRALAGAASFGAPAAAFGNGAPGEGPGGLSRFLGVCRCPPSCSTPVTGRTAGR
ncbi:translation initiation factor IF-2-like [Cuculus canorus]|uniref:translation initiation factor IF-2-like n=1 Tax=Cuculus canorus TaxID=55661 RepID=UPI0023AB2115|nr:translation initiation factor IF-2-like [Cuculus canorus]